jgi:hypothetical protein
MNRVMKQSTNQSITVTRAPLSLSLSLSLSYKQSIHTPMRSSLIPLLFSFLLFDRCNESESNCNGNHCGNQHIKCNQSINIHWLLLCEIKWHHGHWIHRCSPNHKSFDNRVGILARDRGDGLHNTRKRIIFQWNRFGQECILQHNVHRVSEDRSCHFRCRACLLLLYDDRYLGQMREDRRSGFGLEIVVHDLDHKVTGRIEVCDFGFDWHLLLPWKRWIVVCFGHVDATTTRKRCREVWQMLLIDAQQSI